MYLFEHLLRGAFDCGNDALLEGSRDAVAQLPLCGGAGTFLELLQVLHERPLHRLVVQLQALLQQARERRQDRLVHLVGRQW